MRVSWGPSVVNRGHTECTQIYSLIHILKAPRSPLFLNWCHRWLLPCVLTHCVSSDQLKSVQRMNAGLSLFISFSCTIKNEQQPSQEGRTGAYLLSGIFLWSTAPQIKKPPVPLLFGKGKAQWHWLKGEMPLTPSFCLHEGRDCWRERVYLPFPRLNLAHGQYGKGD